MTPPPPALSDPNDDQRVYEWLAAGDLRRRRQPHPVRVRQRQPALWDDDNPDRRLPAIFDGIATPPSSTFAGSTTATSRTRWWTASSTPSPIPTARPSGITATAAATPSKWSSTTATGRPQPNSPIPTRPPTSRNSSARTSRPSTTSRPVPIRDDCFSSFRAGFEIRTLRRCRRVLMFHHFAELGRPDPGAIHRFHLRHQPGDPCFVPDRGHGHRIPKGCGGCLSIGEHAAR